MTTCYPELFYDIIKGVVQYISCCTLAKGACMYVALRINIHIAIAGTKAACSPLVIARVYHYRVATVNLVKIGLQIKSFKQINLFSPKAVVIACNHFSQVKAIFIKSFFNM